MDDRHPQKIIAERLGLTGRRVRQLLAEHILPEPDNEGLYDWPTCAERYRLYSRGTDSDLLNFLDTVEERSRRLEDLVEKVSRPQATMEDMGLAGRETLWVFGALRFLTGVKTEPDSLKQILMRSINRDEADAMAFIFAAMDAYNKRHAPKGTKVKTMREQALAIANSED
jgi:hypothetical protein